jgi:arginine Nomega-methyltransferase
MSVHDYAGMLFRSERIARFQRAIQEAVRPGHSVLEIGTGLGTYAFFAARAGAARVCAIDSKPIVHLAEALSVANGLDEMIDFMLGTAPRDVPEGPFDLIIFEDYPTNFLDKDTFRLLRALGGSHLADGGSFLPGAVRLSLAPVLASAATGGLSVTPNRNAEEGANFGLDWGELRGQLANTGIKVFLAEAALAARAQEGTRISVVPPPSPCDLEMSAEWSDVAGPVGGLALWFDLDLGGGGWASNAPGDSPEPWGQWMLPLDPPIQAAPGRPLKARVWWEELEDGAPGWMAWECQYDGEVWRGHEFAGLPIGAADLGLSKGSSEP